MKTYDERMKTFEEYLKDKTGFFFRPKDERTTFIEKIENAREGETVYLSKMEVLAAAYADPLAYDAEEIRCIAKGYINTYCGRKIVIRG